tara:strand:+ start:806 stop:1183 length:378 start_codon:yes stop_codon:yes gene_type:complete
MATRLTVHVRHNKSDMMFYKTDPVKTYYYKDKGKEKLIGNEEVYQRVGIQFSNKKVFTKMTKARRRIKTTHTFIIESMRKDVVKSHVENILSKLKSKGYQYSWKRSDKGGAFVDHWYLSNCYKCN